MLYEIHWIYVSFCRNHNLFLSLFMTYHQVCNKCNTLGTTRGAETDDPSGKIGKKVNKLFYFSWTVFTLFVVIIICSFPCSWLITRYVTHWVLHMEQKLITLPEHLSSPPVFSGVRVTRSLVLCVCFVDRCLSFCAFSCHCHIRGHLWYDNALQQVPHVYEGWYFTHIRNTLAWLHHFSKRGG
jgi:hypothetical protein